MESTKERTKQAEPEFSNDAVIHRVGPKVGASTLFMRIQDLPQSALLFISLVCVLLLWELGTKAFKISPWILPAPSQIAVALWQGFAANPMSRDSFAYHMVTTLYESLVGFVIGSLIGLVCGTAIAQSRFAEKLLFPYLVAIQSMPKMAIAPLLLIWFGFGLESKIVLVILVTSFPVLINSISGFKSVDPEQIELMRSLCATPSQIFMKVRLPSALPYIFAGLDIAIVSSLLAAVVAEFVGGQRGMGVYLVQLNLGMDVAGVFAILLILSLTGIGLHALLILFQRRFLFWAYETVEEVERSSSTG